MKTKQYEPVLKVKSYLDQQAMPNKPTNTHSFLKTEKNNDSTEKEPNKDIKEIVKEDEKPSELR